MLKMNNSGAATINIASATETKANKIQQTNKNGRKNNKNIHAKAIPKPPITLFSYNLEEYSILLKLFNFNGIERAYMI